MRNFPILLAAVAFLLVSCERSSAKDEKISETFDGEASWFSVKTNGGTETASGEPLRDDALTAAHRTLPFGTRVRVTNLKNGKSEIVRITDRGPFKKTRVLDVTIGTARKLGFEKQGITQVKAEVLAEPAKK